MIENLLCRIPAPIRDSVLALATVMADAAVSQTKRELIELCQAHPELTAEQISLVVARSLHSASPLYLHVSTGAAVNVSPVASVGGS